MNKTAMRWLLAVAAVMLCACAPHANPSAREGTNLAGFWLGVWHGMITLFTFIASWFKSDVGIYEVHNDGHWYDFGYLVGVMLFWGGGHTARGARGGRRSGRERDE